MAGIHITLLMIATYILDCIRIRTKPCKVFQLNAKQFNHQRGIFSKLEIDQNIPKQWRLSQNYDDGVSVPKTWPVFVKPEWGQNASGVRRADNITQLAQIRADNAAEDIRFLVQQGASGKREFEVFSIRHHQDRGRYAVFTVSEAVNDAELNPVNSINNKSTRYVELDDEFDQKMYNQLWLLVDQLGPYNISRASLSADSIEDLLAGHFKVIEINLFLPMPINLLDQKYNTRAIFKKVMHYMMCLAKVTRNRDKLAAEKPVFTKVMMYNRRSKWINTLRARI